MKKDRNEVLGVVSMELLEEFRVADKKIKDLRSEFERRGEELDKERAALWDKVHAETGIPDEEDVNYRIHMGSGAVRRLKSSPADAFMAFIESLDD